MSKTYHIVSWQRHTVKLPEYSDYFTVVGVTDGTEVTVTPSVVPVAGGVVPGTGAPFTVTLNEGDVLEVKTANLGQSLSGSEVVSSNHPIAVFSGHDCALIPEMSNSCDHLEEQLPGVRFWGTEFVASRFPVRHSGEPTEPVLWQIYASEDATEITIEGAAALDGLPVTPALLNRGEMLEFFLTGTQADPGDFYVSATKPIGVMQYMTGYSTADSGLGDPAMVYISSVEQFLPRYVVLVPEAWQEDLLVLTRQAGAEVLIDGSLVPDTVFAAVGSSGYEVARVPIEDGVHLISTGDLGHTLGVIVVGLDSADSYAYSGGMGLAAINVDVE